MAQIRKDSKTLRHSSVFFTNGLEFLFAQKTVFSLIKRYLEPPTEQLDNSVENQTYREIKLRTFFFYFISANKCYINYSFFSSAQPVSKKKKNPNQNNNKKTFFFLHHK